MEEKKKDWSLFIEKGYPFLGSIIIVIIYIIIKPILLDDLNTILNAVISITTILIGFLSTLMALLFSMNDNLIVQKIFEKAHYKLLMKQYFENPIRSGFVSIFLTILLFLRNTILIQNVIWFEIIKIAWIFFIVYLFLSSYRVISIIIKMAFSNKKESNESKRIRTEEEEAQYQELKKKKELDSSN